jgi:hypothetical protein
MQVDAFAVRFRTRQPMEAADLGVRLCQQAARSVFPCYWAVAIPMCLVCFALSGLASWLPTLALWLAKPWLDRTVLFVLARAGFGESTTLSDLWGARAEVWGRQWLSTWTLRRLSWRRSFTQPVYQLEGLRGHALRTRLAILRRRAAGTAAAITTAFSLSESALWMAVLAFIYWMIPAGAWSSPAALLRSSSAGSVGDVVALSYALVVCFLEPFYVGAGFGLYLNRRVELEGWDIEQEFRRAFAV